MRRWTSTGPKARRTGVLVESVTHRPAWGEPMIHHRRTVQIAPGRQADAVARAHEWVAIIKEAASVDVRVSVVTTGTLGRLCYPSDYESMGACYEWH